MKLIHGVFFMFFFMGNLQANTLNISLINCSKIDDKTSRLTCFDKLTTSLDILKNSNIELVHSSKNVSKNDKVEIFGAKHLKHNGLNSDKENKIILTVKSIKKDAYKKLILTFVNGQVWKQSNEVFFSVKPGDKVKLQEGALGAISLNKQGTNRSIRVRRVK